MTNTEPLLLARVGKMSPTCVEEFVALGGFAGLRKAVSMSRDSILDRMLEAKLMGRGGAAYRTGKKWWQLSALDGEPKYIVCDADEGEPGTFKDRLLLSETPLSVIEGMVIAAYLFKSPQGFIYIRGEYRAVQDVVRQAIDNAQKAGYLGKRILGIDGFDFTITVVSGAGAYVCGEDSALINSMEAQSGRPRARPPHPAKCGLYQKPTLVNNVETFACVPIILDRGGKFFRAIGTDYSGGTKLICLSGHVKQPGVYEVPMGITFREIIYGEQYGGGISTGRPLAFYHVGGQSGPIGFPEQLDTPYCYRASKEAGLAVGSGAVVVLDDSVSLPEYMQQVFAFFAHESCGKCTPCRLGVHKLWKQMTVLVERRAAPGALEELEQLAGQISCLSACGLGQSVHRALKSCLKMRRPDFEALLQEKEAV